ncbi:hypothetical protein KGM_211066 [Danaus plexippus plexippus]|uniref:Uncharacterized protein n=1 Tax=Danaus plexippus plexippus TaxID=278856 RepID=A0A212FEI3_DANPL|nr:hypothetical protein KGM_211066 [Danaus plexippus plexippus]
MRGRLLIFILFSLSFISRGKSLKESTNDNGDDIKVRTSEGDRDKEALTIYFDKDRVLSINELRKLYNLDESHIPDIQIGKELDKAYVKKIRLRKNKPKSINEREDNAKEDKVLERSVPENVDTKNIETDNTGLESRISDTEEKMDLEELSADVNERTATTDTNFEEKEKSAEAEENYENDSDYSEYTVRTDEYSKTSQPHQEPTTVFSDYVTPPTGKANTPRFGTEFVERTANSVKDVLAGYQDIVPEIEKTNAFIGTGDIGIVNGYLRALESAKSVENLRRMYPPRRIPTKGTPSYLRSAEPLNEPEQEEVKEDSQDEQLEVKKKDFPALSPGNQYPYTPPLKGNPFQILRSPMPPKPKPLTNMLLPKLRQAYEQPTIPFYNSFKPGDGFQNYGRIVPYYSSYGSYISPTRLYNFSRTG